MSWRPLHAEEIETYRALLESHRPRLARELRALFGFAPVVMIGADGIPQAERLDAAENTVRMMPDFPVGILTEVAVPAGYVRVLCAAADDILIGDVPFVPLETISKLKSHRSSIPK